MMTKMRMAAAAGLFAAVAGGPAVAHHSYAMFDRTKVNVVHGTVKAFEWTNPHIFIGVESNEGGKVVDYGAEGSGPGELTRGGVGANGNGWRFNALKVGDKVTMAYAPLRDGRPGGGLVYIIKADGTRLSGGALDHAAGGPPGGPGGGPGGPGGAPGGPGASGAGTH